jgi:uncharacterized membrane protein YhiD involved in acid resistance
MNKETVDILVHLLVAMVAGGLIGLERSYYGRPAGFRTHTLVCMASSLPMLVTIYQRDWFIGFRLPHFFIVNVHDFSRRGSFDCRSVLCPA